MRYRLTILTPTLVGDGQRLAPIDYMVWRDQVNVLDQRRIFRLLSRGPRLENYLVQLRKAEKLDFASWGGFAQNYAGRRIPFEHASSSHYWQSAPAECLHIPTFASGLNGPFLPASALKGALRTGYLFSRWSEGTLKEVNARLSGDRPLRRPGEFAENMTTPASADPLRLIMAADSDPVKLDPFRVYLVRTATLQGRSADSLDLGWKLPRGAAPGRAPEQSVPTFAEMATPGMTFEGRWIVRARKDAPRVDRIFPAINDHASELLASQIQYAEAAGLSRMRENLARLSERLEAIKTNRSACVLNIGWAGGFLTKASFLDTANEEYKNILRRDPLYERAVRSGMPFPKTRRVVFEGDQPSTMPGWALLETIGSAD